MSDVDAATVGGRAFCDDCDWSTEGKNAMGNAAQHHQKTGHVLQGELEQAFWVGRESKDNRASADADPDDDEVNEP